MPEFRLFNNNEEVYEEIKYYFKWLLIFEILNTYLNYLEIS